MIRFTKLTINPCGGFLFLKLAPNVLQISEGGLMRLVCFARFCLCAVMRSPYFFVLIFSKLETILKINKKYFEKSLQLSKFVVDLYQQLSK